MDILLLDRLVNLERDFWEAKSPPQVGTEVPHTGFPIWRSSDPMTGSLFLIDFLTISFENQRG
jgi:hypothetical protein